MKRFIIFLFILLFSFGCTSQTQTTTATDPFIGGTTGLKLDFVEAAPPEEAYDKGTYPFDVAVLLENVGEYSVTKDNVLVKISGFDPTDFGKSQEFMQKHPDDDLQKTYKNSEGRVIEGMTTSVEFNGFTYNQNLTGNTPFPIRASVCYSYGTTANAILCYREDILDIANDENAICEINDEKTVYNSGAPVQIENFKETARGTNKIGFNFDIKHKGSGDIFEKASVCDDSDRKFEDVVYVTVDTGLPGLSCSSLDSGTEGSMKLYGGHKTISCTQEVSNPTDFEKPVTITVEYDYEEDKTTEIIIKHSVD